MRGNLIKLLAINTFLIMLVIALNTYTKIVIGVLPLIFILMVYNALYISGAYIVKKNYHKRNIEKIYLIYSLIRIMVLLLLMLTLLLIYKENIYAIVIVALTAYILYTVNDVWHVTHIIKQSKINKNR